jgi:WD40 repeat protein
MGGLVVKKAYILGHQEPEFSTLVNRISSILFLGTPHQGSALAQTLSALMAMLPGNRPFVGDLSPQSGMLQAINEEFPRVCSNLQLMSFYETRTMNLGVQKSLIVEKTSAVMNLPNERRTLLDADHRNIAMFPSPDNSAFLAIRNALASILDSQRQISSHEQKQKQSETEDYVAINRFLGITSAPEDELMTHDSARLPGSCEWLANKDYYCSWRKTTESRFLWLRGMPGAGKSVLAGQVVNELRNDELDCCFFFFHAGDKTKSSVSTCLLSLAWQMATLNAEVSEKLCKVLVESKEETIDKTDASSVWRKVFLPGILKARLNRNHFWVIDAMDECRGSVELMGYLLRIQEQWPVSIFVTSRDPLEAHLGHSNTRVDIRTEVISAEDSSRDISKYLKSHVSLLPCPTTSKWSDRGDMAAQITQQSGGCFLWASLICSELREAYTEKEIDKVLESVPSNMDSLYSKALDTMSTARFGKNLAKSVLTWTTYTFRALSVDEIKEPIEIDIEDKIDDVERSISKCCGHFVFVDTVGRVQLVHSTAREFLTRQDRESEFVVPKSEAHRRLAAVCLRCLTKGETSYQKARRLGVDADSQLTQSTSSPFATYASTYLFQHLQLVHSKNDELLLSLSKFLGSSSILRWIEFIASTGDLQPIYLAGKIINSLLARRAQHSPPLKFGPKNLSLLEKWGDDLIHLAAKFASRLRCSPQSIQHLIPPFCPQGSALRQQFVNQYRGISVCGLSGRGWDDCLTTITYPKGTKPNAVAAGSGFFAVGMINGNAVLYDDSICQEIHTLHHQEAIWRMEFSSDGEYLATAGAKKVRIWSTRQGIELSSIPIGSVCLAIAFGDDDTVLRIATRQNQVLEWDMGTQGYFHDPLDWATDLEESYQSKTASIVKVSSEAPLMAIAYRGEDIVIWDYAEERVHDVYEQETGSKMHESIKVSGTPTTACAVAFGDAGDSNRIAVTYVDGILVVYDTLDGTPVAKVQDANTMILAASPDGRTLAGADSRGNLTLFDFETLNCLYRVQFDSAIIPKGLVFTAGGRRFVEIRGDQCRVWEPTVLLRPGEVDDDNSDTVSISTGPREISYERTHIINITCIACCRLWSLVFCGKEDGSVHVYDISSDSVGQELFFQALGHPVTVLSVSESPLLLASGDISGSVMVRKLKSKATPQRVTACEIEDEIAAIHSPNCGVLKQVLISPDHNKILVATERHHTIWSIPNKSSGTWLARLEGQSNDHWISHPSSPNLLIRKHDLGFDILTWTTFELVSSFSTSKFGELSRAISLDHTRIFATTRIECATLGQSRHLSIQIWDCGELKDGSITNVPKRTLDGLSPKIEHVIGAYGSRMVILTGDHWIASLDVNDGPKGEIVKHFFIPDDWISVVNRFVIGIGRTGEILFAKQSELAVIKRGLETLEMGGTFNPRRGSGSRLERNSVGRTEVFNEANIQRRR